ncbi:hypothetical protein [Erwinia mallotivora]|uniref:hypothetical protein n=1 Tax=Erwinia mallotivora TaxID=69222 RepID=UPI0021BE5F0E|nr:hypothetical protein [Erwinia mallotivora]
MVKAVKLNVSYGLTALMMAVTYLALLAFCFSKISNVFDAPDSPSDVLWTAWRYVAVFTLLPVLLAFLTGKKAMTIRHILVKVIKLIISPIAAVLAIFSVFMLIKTGSPSLHSLFWLVLALGLVLAQVFCSFHIMQTAEKRAQSSKV